VPIFSKGRYKRNVVYKILIHTILEIISLMIVISENTLDIKKENPLVYDC